MKVQGRCFPYEKSIVINALYDTIEALGLCLDSSDSIRGTLIVSDEEKTWRVCITLSIAEGAGSTQVNVSPKDSDCNTCDVWGAVIFDELSATVQKACYVKGKHMKKKEPL